MPRFVMLAHDWPVPHVDLMFDAGDALASWRLAALPTPGVAVAAERAADHRRAYLDYEGEVAGGRGTVRRVLAGTFDGDIAAADWAVTLTLSSGEVLAATMAAGRFQLGSPDSPGSMLRHQSA